MFSTVKPMSSALGTLSTFKAAIPSKKAVLNENPFSSGLASFFFFALCSMLFALCEQTNFNKK